MDTNTPWVRKEIPCTPPLTSRVYWTAYQIARHLGICIVTYFDHIDWLAVDSRNQL